MNFRNMCNKSAANYFTPQYVSYRVQIMFTFKTNQGPTCPWISLKIALCGKLGNLNAVCVVAQHPSVD